MRKNNNVLVTVRADSIGSYLSERLISNNNFVVIL